MLRTSQARSQIPRLAKDRVMNRRGEKIGWIGGWFGGFVWLGLLSVVWIFQDKIINGMTGIIVFIVAIITIIASAPWKHPNTKYWKLMIPIYLLFFASITLSIYLYGGPNNIGLKWTSIFWLVPCLIPFVTTGSKTWNGNMKGDRPN